jgi:hypothetical protein
MAGKSKCRHLIVGITNPDPALTRKDAADPARSSADANPFTYYERYQMVKTTVGVRKNSKCFNLRASRLKFYGEDLLKKKGCPQLISESLSQDEPWEHLVPPAACHFLKAFDLLDRLKNRCPSGHG